MKWFSAAMKVTFHTLPLLFHAKVTFKLKFVKIEFASELCEANVLFFEPDFVNPIDTRDVYPFFGL